VSEVGTVFDGVVRRHDARYEEHHHPNSVSNHEEGTYVSEKAGKRDLVQVMVKELANGRAIVNPPGLLSINCIDCLKPKAAEEAQKYYPMR